MNDNKWQIGFWIITVLVVGSFSWTTFCAFDNQRKIEDLMAKHYELKDVANDGLHKIDLRLSRIEDKLGIEK